MTLRDLLSPAPDDRTADRRRLSEPWSAWNAATAAEEPPLGALDVRALRANAADLVRRADGKPIRLVSKSIRVRSVIEALLDVPGFAGVLAVTLPEALWLARSCPDVVVGYPTADRQAIADLARSEQAAASVTLMVDSVEHLDLIDAVASPASRCRSGYASTWTRRGRGPLRSVDWGSGARRCTPRPKCGLSPRRCSAVLASPWWA